MAEFTQDTPKFYANESLYNLIFYVLNSEYSNKLGNLNILFADFLNTKSDYWQNSLDDNFDYRKQIQVLNAVFQDYCIKELNIPFGDKFEDFDGINKFYRTIQEIHHRMCQLGFNININRLFRDVILSGRVTIELFFKSSSFKLFKFPIFSGRCVRL